MNIQDEPDEDEQLAKFVEMLMPAVRHQHAKRSEMELQYQRGSYLDAMVLTEISMNLILSDCHEREDDRDATLKLDRLPKMRFGQKANVIGRIVQSRGLDAIGWGDLGTDLAGANRFRNDLAHRAFFGGSQGPDGSAQSALTLAGRGNNLLEPLDIELEDLSLRALKAWGLAGSVARFSGAVEQVALGVAVEDLDLRYHLIRLPPDEVPG